VADYVVISGSPCTAKIRNPWAVLGLTLVTVGIYSLFWWYFINREMRDLGRARAEGGFGERPELSALAFSGLSAFTLWISLVWTVVTTSRRVRRSQAVTGHDGRLNGWISGALWIGTLSLGGIVYTQSELNKAWRTQPVAVPGESATVPVAPAALQSDGAPQPFVEDPDEWPAEHPALWDTVTRRAYEKRYGKKPGAA
jgi:hypothetical protein